MGLPTVGLVTRRIAGLATVGLGTRTIGDTRATVGLLMDGDTTGLTTGDTTGDTAGLTTGDTTGETAGLPGIPAGMGGYQPRAPSFPIASPVAGRQAILQYHDTPTPKRAEMRGKGEQSTEMGGFRDWKDKKVRMGAEQGRRRQAGFTRTLPREHVRTP